MKLYISRKILNKANYFLNQFPSKEWSGPAWYSCKTDKDNFPEQFTLEDFHPLDLGSSAATEWEAGDLAKILKSKYEEKKKLKKCFLGLIHSHHDMGAFFSGTDEETIREMAHETGFYPSLIVSTKADKKYAFGFSYLDQYNKSTVFEIEKKNIVTDSVKPDKEWEAIKKTIEKKAKPKTKVQTYSPAYNGWGYGGYQGAFFNEEDSFIGDGGLDEEKIQKGRDIWSKYRNAQNTMNHQEMLDEMKKIGIDNPYKVFSGTGYHY